MAKQHLVENFSKDWNEPLHINRLALNESSKIIEANGKKYPVTEGFEVPLWRLGKENLNGRIYSRALGEKVVKENKDLITVNLADHPEDDGSVSNIMAISKNPHIKEDILYVDTYPVDEVFEKKLNKMLELGAGLGVSSSCYGDINESTHEVIADGFEVQRWHDFVTAPSFSVYVTEDCRINNESTETKKESIKENVTIDNIKESNIMPDKMQKLSEKTMRLNLAKIIEDADKHEIISERILALEEAASYVSEDFLPDMKKDIEEKINNLKKESLVLAEKGKTVDKLAKDIQLKESEKVSLQEKISTLEESYKSLNEKYTASCKLLDETKDYANKAVDLFESADAEAGSRFTAKEYLTIVEHLETIQSENKINENKLVELQEKLNNIVSSNNSYKEKVATLEKTISEMKVVIDGYEAVTDVEPENNDEYNTDEFDYSDYGPEADTSVELDIANDDEVETYYNDLYDSDPRYEAVKTEILKCKTILEAQKTALRLKNLVEGQDKSHKTIKESISYTDVDIGKIKQKGWL